MNALKALERKTLQKSDKLGLCLFHPRHGDKNWSEKTWYITDIVHHYNGPTEVYVSETNPSEHASYKYDMILTTKKKKKYRERIDYLRYFKPLND
ncbi:MAG: hypothetical protein MUP55_03200 [Candidatus Aenigmarchaeota archaeon]|nr:hypothetical protein [Candidatus Aenigmarchaeota archaeon]